MASTETEQTFQIGLMFEHAARRHAVVPVILDEPLQLAPALGTRTTVADLAELIDELAARLWAAGVRPSEQVAVYKTHNFDIALLACATSRIGAVPVLLSPGLPPAVATELMNRLDDPWLLTDAGHLASAFGGVVPAGLARQVLLTAGSEVADTVSLAARAGAPRREPVRVHPRQPSLITHSSGTTGIPKLAVHCGDSLYRRLVPQKLMAYPIRRRETVALCMTFAHSRFLNALRVFLDYGNPLVIAAGHEPDRIGPLFAATRPGYVETHPNTYIEWEELSGAPDGPLSNVLVFGATFDAMHPRTIQRLLAGSGRRFPVFVQLYGQSETGPVCMRWYTRRTAGAGDTRRVGVPVPWFVRLRVTDDKGRRVRRGRVGHLEVRLRSRVLTYLGEQSRYGEVFNGDWWRMGDMGFRDRWGSVFLLDREVDRIDSMESNLRAEDVLMSRLDELREVAIVAGPDGAAVPVVCVRGERPLDLARWRSAAAEFPELAEPVQLPFDQVPRTSTWKVQRPELVRMLQDAAR